MNNFDIHFLPILSFSYWCCWHGENKALLVRLIVGIYKSLAVTWMWKLGTRPCSFISGHICFEFLVQCLCSVPFFSSCLYLPIAARRNSSNPRWILFPPLPPSPPLPDYQHQWFPDEIPTFRRRPVPSGPGSQQFLYRIKNGKCILITRIIVLQREFLIISLIFLHVWIW